MHVCVSLSLCDCVCVCVGGGGGGWESVILQVAHGGPSCCCPLPITPRLLHLWNALYLDQNTQSRQLSFLSDSGGQLKRFKGNAITNCWFKRDHSGKATTIMVLLFISLHEAITISILAPYVIWLVSGLKLQNGLCWTDFIIVQCSRRWWAITLYARTFIYLIPSLPWQWRLSHSCKHAVILAFISFYFTNLRICRQTFDTISVSQAWSCLQRKTHKLIHQAGKYKTPTQATGTCFLIWNILFIIFIILHLIHLSF